MLFSLGRRIVYERETRTRKPTPKPDALSQWRTMEVQRNHVTWMENFRSKRYGILPVESRRTGGVSGPVPQKDPPKATGGYPVPMRGPRLRKRRVNATGQKSPNHSTTIRPLNILHLQWNAEGVFNKKVPLTERLHKEDVDVACIQETHLNTNHRFSIRGYQTFRLDREGRHKGGVLILVRNNIAASDFKVDTNQQAEIHGVKITVDNSAINIFNLYWQIENNMLLLNDPEDPPTFFSRRWISTSTPNLAFATEDLSQKTNRKVLSQLAGSDHRPVLLAIDLQYRPSNPKTFPRLNYKKADWEMFSRLTNEYCKTVKAGHFNINKATDSFNQSILRAASETIPYRPYWTEELQGLEDEVARTREKVENNPTPQNNIAHNACTAKYRKAYIQAAKTSWREKNRKAELGQRWQQTLETNQGHE